jgi:acyloxyacyl hydrolase
VDHNCNGIHGQNGQGQSYEDLLCSGTKQYGLVVLGDSAAAHFHVPPDFFMAERINATTFHSLLDILSMEFDWPEVWFSLLCTRALFLITITQMSAATGFKNSSWTGRPVGPMSSTYMSYVQRNLCMHRGKLD